MEQQKRVTMNNAKKKFTLKEVCLNIIDCPHKTAPTQEFGIPSIRTTDISNGKIDLDKANKVSEDTYATWTERAVPEPMDIILAREAPVGEVGIIPLNAKVCLGQRTVLIKPNPKIVDNKYLLYILMSREMKHQFISRAEGSVVPHLNVKAIKEIALPQLPPLPVQYRISAILSSLDDMFENNRKTCEKLEEIAQAIFKRWFVDFEFPNEEGLPYRSSGGEMVYCGDLGKEIPKGWKVCRLEEIVTITRGASPRPIQDYLRNEGIPWVKIADATKNNSKFIFETNECIKPEGKAMSRPVVPGQLILSNSATPGIPRIMQIDACVHDGWLIFIDYKDITKEFVYNYLIFNRDEILSKSNGSVFRNLKTDILKNSLVVLPQKEVLDQISNTFVKIDAINLNLQKAIRTLQEVRDSLLPKLMSGELAVDEVEVR